MTWIDDGKQLCKDCKHWNQRFGASPTEPGSCARAEGVSGGKADQESFSMALDSEFYSAGLVTEPTFSCCQFEPKV